MIACDRCARRFGGQFAFDRHFDRRKDRCRTDAALRARHLVQGSDLVWHQGRGFNRQMRLWKDRPGRPRNRAQTLWGRGKPADRGPVRSKAHPEQLVLAEGLL